MKISTLDRKKFRVRNKLKKVSSKDRFRLCVSRSTKNISALIIDDVNKITLVSASSQDKKITKVYFDRGIYKYHGRVKIFAETLRKNGMEF